MNRWRLVLEFESDKESWDFDDDITRVSSQTHESRIAVEKFINGKCVLFSFGRVEKPDA